MFSGGSPGSQMIFSLSWFAFVFPNVGFTIGTSKILAHHHYAPYLCLLVLLAEEFDSYALKVVTAVMTVILAVGLILLWIGAFRAVW